VTKYTIRQITSGFTIDKCMTWLKL
jgi:hypothetical protein